MEHRQLEFVAQSGRSYAPPRSFIVYVLPEGPAAPHEPFPLGGVNGMSRWAEIYELNRDVLGEDFDYLAPGTQLVLPGGSRRENEAMTRQPSPGYRR